MAGLHLTGALLVQLLCLLLKTSASLVASFHWFAKASLETPPDSSLANALHFLYTFTTISLSCKSWFKLSCTSCPSCVELYELTLHLQSHCNVLYCVSICFVLGGGGNRAEKHENDIGQRYFCNYCPKLKKLNW